MDKKILFISHWYPTEKNPISGKFIKNHAEAISLVAKINVVHFDIQDSSKLLDIKLLKIIDKSIETYKIQISSKFYKLFYYSINFQYFLFKRLIKKFNIDLSAFDLVHSNVLFPSGLIAFKISKRNKIKQVHTEHWSKISRFLEKDILRRSGRRALAKMTAISSVSENFKTILKRYYPEKSIFIVPNIIDNKIFNVQNKIRKQKSIAFLSVANWQEPKHPFYFLDALEKVFSINKFDFTLTIAGEGKLLEKVKNNSYSFPINFVGTVDSNQLNNLLNCSNFLLHASKFETFSVIIIEALMSGTPALVSDVGIASEVINSSNGAICEDNSEHWFNQINFSIIKEYDYQEISDLIIDNYSPEKIAQKFNLMYDFALENA
jgi:glycosyltransferase involved in cell wall biosynthesis